MKTANLIVTQKAPDIELKVPLDLVYSPVLREEKKAKSIERKQIVNSHLL